MDIKTLVFIKEAIDGHYQRERGKILSTREDSAINEARYKPTHPDGVWHLWVARCNQQLEELAAHRAEVRAWLVSQGYVFNAGEWE